jgi:hypothetical protein
VSLVHVEGVLYKKFSVALLSMFSCPLDPSCYRALIESERPHNGLEWAARGDKGITTVMSQSGLRNPSSIVPAFRQNTLPHVLQRERGR